MKNKIKKFIVTGLLIYCVTGLLKTSPLLAQEDSSSSAIPKEKVMEEIKKQIEQGANQNLDKIKGVLEQQAKNKLYGYAGKIKSIDQQTLTLDTSDGLKQVEVASSATIYKLSAKQVKTTITFDQIEIDEFIIALGSKEEKEVLLGKRLLVIPLPSPGLKRKIVTGQVTEIDDTKIILKSSLGQETISLETDAKTRLKINGVRSPKIDNIQIGDQVNAIVSVDSEDKIDRTLIVLVIPGKANPAALENEVVASPSATPSASPIKKKS